MPTGLKKQSRAVVKKRWKYFYVDDKLHRLLAMNRGRDEIIAWSYPDRERRIYSWSAVKRYGEPGLRTKEAAEILNRHNITLLKYLHLNWVPRPQRTYKIPDGTNPGIHIWRKSDILKALDHASNIHKGWARKDGFINAPHLPSRSEVHAEAEYNMKLYAKDSDGNLVRIWAAEGDDF